MDALSLSLFFSVSLSLPSVSQFLLLISLQVNPSKKIKRFESAVCLVFTRVKLRQIYGREHLSHLEEPIATTKKIKNKEENCPREAGETD